MARDPQMPYSLYCSCGRKCGVSSHRDYGEAMCGPCYEWHRLLAAILQG